MCQAVDLTGDSPRDLSDEAVRVLGEEVGAATGHEAAELDVLLNLIHGEGSQGAADEHPVEQGMIGGVLEAGAETVLAEQQDADQLLLWHLDV